MDHASKRSADDAGVGGSDDGGGKNPRLTGGQHSNMAALDIRVMNRLDDMIASGLIADGELDAKAIGELADFEPQDALGVLDQFEHSGLAGVRNKSAYLHGVMIRFRKDPGPRLDPDVNARLDKLFRSSKVKASDFDGRVYEGLAMLPPHLAIRAIDRFQAKVTDDVRNVSAFFTAMLRQEHQNMAEAPYERPGGGGGFRDGPPGPRDRGGPPYRGRPQYDDRYGEPEPYDPYGGPPPPRQHMGPPPGHAHHPPPHHHAPPPMHVVAAPAPAPAPAPVAPQIVVLSPEQLAQLQQPGGGAAVSLQSLLPQLVAALQQQQGQQAQPQQSLVQQPQIVIPQQQVLAPAPGYPPATPMTSSGKRSYALEHAQMGVRVAEFHNLSTFSEFVHPAPALKLQQLWDGGNRLVSLLDDRTWEVLSELGAPEALAVVEQVAENMKRQDLRNPNAYFMSCAKKYLDKSRQDYGGGGAARGPPYPSSSSDRGRYGDRPSQPAGGSRGGGRDYGNRPPPHHGAIGVSGFDSMPETLQRHAREAIARHHPLLTESTFDEGVTEYLKRLSEEDAVSVFEEMKAADLGNVRNVSAYVMGMIRKRRHEGSAGPPGRR